MANQANDRITVNTIILAFRMVVVLVITLFTTRMVLKALGAVDYGIYNVVAAFVSMCAFVSSSMANGIQRFHNYELGKNGTEGATKVFNTGVQIQALFSVLIVIVAEAIGAWYISSKLNVPIERLSAAKVVFQFSLATLVFHMSQVPFRTAILAHEKMNFYAIVTIFDSVFKLAIAIIISYLSFDKLIFYSILMMIESIIVLILYFVFAKIHFEEIKFKNQFHPSLFRSMLSFSGWNVFGTTARMMRNQGLGLVMNLFFGPIVNAAQAVANQVNSAFQQLVANLPIAARPQLIQSYSQGNEHRALNLFYSISKLTQFLCMFAAIPIMLELQYVLKLWLGESIPDGTYMFVVITILTIIVMNLHSMTSELVHAIGKLKKYQLVCSILNLLILPLAYIAFKKGAEAEVSYWIGFVLEIIIQIASLFVLKELIHFSIKSYIKEVLWPFLKVLMISIIWPVIPHFFMEQGLVRLIVVCMASTIALTLSVRFLGLNSSELEIVQSLLNKFVPIKKIVKRNDK